MSKESDIASFVSQSISIHLDKRLQDKYADNNFNK